MIDGNFTYYTFQHRYTHKSPWLNPQGKLKKVFDQEWHNSNWDVFGKVAEPWNNYKPKYPISHKETYEVYCSVGRHGWWSLKYAEKALKRLQKAQSKGRLDYKDGYNNVCQTIRYEFRIVKITVSKYTEIIEGKFKCLKFIIK
jgi:hypothetical protein